MSRQLVSIHKWIDDTTLSRDWPRWPEHWPRGNGPPANLIAGSQNCLASETPKIRHSGRLLPRKSACGRLTFDCPVIRDRHNWTFAPTLL